MQYGNKVYFYAQIRYNTNMSKSQSIVEFSDMVEQLEEVGKISNIKVNHADFKTGHIIVSMEGSGPPASFEDMMVRIKFVEMIDRLIVEDANFVTGEITIKVLKHSKEFEPTSEEVDLICRHQKIRAIKSVRARRQGITLGAAKTLVESWENRVFERNKKVF